MEDEGGGKLKVKIEKLKLKSIIERWEVGG
jgi:hypothetical protein